MVAKRFNLNDVRVLTLDEKRLLYDYSIRIRVFYVGKCDSIGLIGDHYINPIYKLKLDIFACHFSGNFYFWLTQMIYCPLILLLTPAVVLLTDN